MKAILKKITWNKGQTDNGVGFDYTRVFVEVPVSESSSNEFGYDVVQCEYGDESKKADLEYLRGKLPVSVEIDLMPEVKGKRVLQRVLSMRVLDDVKTGKLIEQK